jgi:molybdopterin-binding protein
MAMKISARNVLPGKVKAVTPGAVNTEVVIEMAGGVEIVSIITRDSADRLGLVAGREVYAVIKASDVMVATGD